MSDVVTGAIIGASAVVVGGIVAGEFDLRARRQDRKHDSTERAADRADAAATRIEEREAAKRATWQERAAATLAQAREFAAEIHPSRLGLFMNAEQARPRAEELEAKWEALREPLGVLIMGLPTVSERDLAEEVYGLLRNVYVGIWWNLVDTAYGRRVEAAHILEQQAEWDTASAKLRDLREAVHGILPAVVPSLGPEDMTKPEPGQQ